MKKPKETKGKGTRKENWRTPNWTYEDLQVKPNKCDKNSHRETYQKSHQRTHNVIHNVHWIVSDNQSCKMVESPYTFGLKENRRKWKEWRFMTQLILYHISKETY